MEKFFINRPIFAIALSIALLVVGGVAILNLPIEQYPDITPPVVEVTASYPGADAETVDDAVAVPLIQQIMGVSDMLYLESTAANDGSLSIDVTFAIGSDPDMDAIFTQNRVARAVPSLPSAVNEQGVTTQKTMSGFLMVYALYSDGRYDDTFLANYAYLHIEDELLKINGVGKVSIMGAGPYAMRIWLKPDLLHYYGLTVDEVAEAIERQSGIYPGGKFGAEPAPAGTPYTYTVAMPPQISEAGQFADILVKVQADGSVVRLGDVAQVELGAQSYGSTSSFEGNPSALVVIYQQPGSNAVEVGAAVAKRMEELKTKFYDGIDYRTIVDATASIRAGIEDIFVTLLVALLLVVVIIYLFLQEWRAVLIPLIAIPVSLVGAFALFPLLGFSINIISLLGLVLAIGLVVDDAIVVVEAVQLNLAAGEAPREATYHAMQRVSSPIIATTVVLLAVFIPVSFTGGITGLMFQQFSITIAVSVLLSAFTALSLTPALCVLLLRPHKAPERGFFAAFNRLFDRGMARYDRAATRFILGWRRTALVLLLAVVAIVGMWRYLPKGFLPEEDQGYLMVMAELPPASSLQRTQKAMEHLERVVAAHEAVSESSYAAGFNMMSGVASPSSGVLFVALKPYNERTLSAMELAQKLNEELFVAIPEAECYAVVPPAIPGLGVSSDLSMMVEELSVGEAEGGASELSRQTMRWMEVLEKLPEIGSVSTQYNDKLPRRRLEIDKERALMLGVDLGALYGELSTLLGGQYLNNFSRFGRLYQSYLQAAPDYRIDPASLRRYFVAGADGSSVPLSDFVTVRDTSGVAFVTRFDGYPAIALNLQPAEGYSTGDVMAAAEASAAEELPDGIGYAWSGISYQEAATSRSGGWVYLLALVFVFLTLAALYNSWGLPLAILLSVPLAVAGALLFIGGGHLLSPLLVNDLYLQISLVMLIGLAAKNAILVAEYADRLFFEQGLSLEEAARGAAHLRVRPILMTAFAFILGVLPLVFAHGVYSTARHVMGVALVGGMLVATLVGIFLYPALYYIIARLGGFEKRREKMKNIAPL